jgi:hypothetical protein
MISLMIEYQIPKVNITISNRKKYKQNKWTAQKTEIECPKSLNLYFDVKNINFLRLFSIRKLKFKNHTISHESQCKLRVIQIQQFGN